MSTAGYRVFLDYTGQLRLIKRESSFSVVHTCQVGRERFIADTSSATAYVSSCLHLSKQNKVTSKVRLSHSRRDVKYLNGALWAVLRNSERHHYANSVQEEWNRLSVIS